MREGSFHMREGICRSDVACVCENIGLSSGNARTALWKFRPLLWNCRALLRSLDLLAEILGFSSECFVDM